ncbi:MAG: transcription termination factor Rho [Deltaproteobacteria bacterium]|nr:transcription termination factor Rho [Deltaproteobacteria bacterium]
MTEETGKKEHEKPLEKLTVKELREIALTLPHSTAVHDLKKEELVAFIKEARGIKEEAPHKARKKAAVKVKLTKAEIKARIRELKDQKRQAQEGKDGTKTKALRRVISRLKKKSREAA